MKASSIMARLIAAILATSHCTADALDLPPRAQGASSE
jgi:hypothetical protein